MKSFPPRNRRGKKADEPTTLTRSDKLQIITFLTLLVVLLLGYVWVHIRYEKKRFAESLEHTINEWRTVYHLDSAQAEQIMALEFTFHGNGNSLTAPTHTPPETDVHHQQIASRMNPEDGAKFLADQRKF